MTEWVALLRGVNVGGVTIRSADLAEVFRGLGLERVKTVLASGNVLFTSREEAPELTTRIETALRERFGYDARVHVLDIPSLRRIIAAYPFEERDGWHAYVIFLMGEGPRSLLELSPTLDAGREQLADGDTVLYWSVEKGNTLGSTIGKASARSGIKTQSTTRNLRTLRRLVG